MANVSALIEKISGWKAKLIEKTDKIGFLKAWRAKKAVSPAALQKAPNSVSLGGIYREGGVGTRLQVIAFYLFILVALVSAGSVLKKVIGKLRNASGHGQLEKEYSAQLTEVNRKVVEKADMISLGQFTANAFTGAGEKKTMSLDLWLRVSDPEAASAINAKNEIFRDRTLDALHELFTSGTNLLGDEGKALAREKIRESLNSLLKKGQVEEVFIQNLVME